MYSFLRTVSGIAWKEDVEEGKEWIYGSVGVGFVGARRTWSCRARYWLPGGILPEGITEKVRDQEWIPFTLTLVHFPTEIRVFVVHGPPAIWGSLFQFSGLWMDVGQVRFPRTR